MMDWKTLSSEEFEQAVAEERARRMKNHLPVPVRLPNPDFTELIEMMEEVKNKSIADGYENANFQEYVFEMAMDAVYGKDIWKHKKNSLRFIAFR